MSTFPNIDIKLSCGTVAAAMREEDFTELVKTNSWHVKVPAFHQGGAARLHLIVFTISDQTQTLADLNEAMKSFPYRCVALKSKSAIKLAFPTQCEITKVGTRLATASLLKSLLDISVTHEPRVSKEPIAKAKEVSWMGEKTFIKPIPPDSLDKKIVRIKGVPKQETFDFLEYGPDVKNFRRDVILAASDMYQKNWSLSDAIKAIDHDTLRAKKLFIPNENVQSLIMKVYKGQLETPELPSKPINFEFDPSLNLHHTDETPMYLLQDIFGEHFPLRDSELNLIAGQTGRGKSTFACNTVADFLQNETIKKVLYVCTEEKTSEIFKKISCVIAGIPWKSMQAKKLSSKQKEVYEKLQKPLLKQLHVIGKDNPQVVVSHLEGVKAVFEQAILKNEYGLIVLDHIQGICESTEFTHSFEISKDFMEFLNKFRSKYSVPVLVTSQLDSAGKNSDFSMRTQNNKTLLNYFNYALEIDADHRRNVSTFCIVKNRADGECVGKIFSTNHSQGVYS